MNAMDKALQELINVTIEQDFHLPEYGGPQTFAVMIDKVINLSEGAVEAMIWHIMSYDISKCTMYTLKWYTKNC